MNVALCFIGECSFVLLGCQSRREKSIESLILDVMVGKLSFFFQGLISFSSLLTLDRCSWLAEDNCSRVHLKLQLLKNKNLKRKVVSFSWCMFSMREVLIPTN